MPVLARGLTEGGSRRRDVTAQGKNPREVAFALRVA